MLREARGVSVIATSREGLRVDGEQLVSVASLDDEAAAQLFAERATAADASFVIGDAEAVLVERICARLDGMPLAIELAAARARMFSLDELAARVEQRFRLLTGGRAGVERHQTLRAAIDWSYDLLDADTRVVFARLSVFAAGWTLDAAEAVAADDDRVDRDAVIDLLSDLVDKSLVTVDRSRAETRYGMLETIRQYAEERLVASGEADEVRGRHTRWAATFARAAGRGLYSADDVAWLERLRPEVDNLQVAASWAVATGDSESATSLLDVLHRLADAAYLIGGLTTGRCTSSTMPSPNARQMDDPVARQRSPRSSRPVPVGRWRPRTGARDVRRGVGDVSGIAADGATGSSARGVRPGADARVAQRRGRRGRAARQSTSRRRPATERRGATRATRSAPHSARSGSSTKASHCFERRSRSRKKSTTSTMSAVRTSTCRRSCGRAGGSRRR